jgi:hypothetical protein
MQSYYHHAEGRRCELTHLNRAEVCAMLAQENTRSLEARYTPAQAGASVGGFPRHPSKALNLSAVAILKALDCYEYQSCEHDGWRDSEAFAFCEALRGTLISKLPGYDGAETWGIE